MVPTGSIEDLKEVVPHRSSTSDLMAFFVYDPAGGPGQRRAWPIMLRYIRRYSPQRLGA